MKYLTWVNGLRGPSPQVWAEKDMTQEGKPVAKLQQHEINEAEAALGLKVLAVAYPYEQPVND